MLRLRGHHLLCLHGFRGMGYSPEFVANMTIIRDRLISSPETPVAAIVSPDDICAACPHLRGNSCAKSGIDSESRISAKDSHVLSLAGIAPGAILAASDLLSIVSSVFAHNLAATCSSCEWYSLGWCEDGLTSGLAPASGSSTAPLSGSTPDPLFRDTPVPLSECSPDPLFRDTLVPKP